MAYLPNGKVEGGEVPRLRSTAFKLWRCIPTISSLTIRCVLHSPCASWECAPMLHVISKLKGTGILTAECAVPPQSKYWAATADDATDRTLIFLDFKKHWMAIDTNLFLVPSGALRKKCHGKWICDLKAGLSKLSMHTFGRTELKNLLKTWRWPELNCRADLLASCRSWYCVCCCCNDASD